MQSYVLYCWSCDAQFLTFTALSNHHLAAHEQPLPSRLLPSVVETPGVTRHPGLRVEERLSPPLGNGTQGQEGEK